MRFPSRAQQRVAVGVAAVALAYGVTACGGGDKGTGPSRPAPAALAKIGGDGQTGPVAHPLAAPLLVRVTDVHGGAAAGVAVAWSVVEGGGSVGAGSSATDSAGRASVSWTLGPAVGTNSARASVAGLPPVVFTATAAPWLTSIQPDTLIEGRTATLTGTGFSARASEDTVRIGGVRAEVTAASGTSLTITVPASDCQPARDAGVSVTVGAATGNALTKRVHPPSFLALAVGQQAVLVDPGSFCLQFGASPRGGDAYLVGLGAAAENPSATLPIVVTGVAGAAPTAQASTPAVAPVRRIWSAPVSLPGSRWMARRLQRMRAQLLLHEWEQAHLGHVVRSGPAAPAVGPSPRGGPPAVGDTVRVRFPSYTSPCTAYTEVLTRVRVVGQGGIWLTDTGNPTTDSLTTADIQAFSTLLDTKVLATDTSYFGAPSDIDGNGRVVIVLSIRVNAEPGIAGFAFSGDLFDRAECASSNVGEFFYGIVPDPNDVAGTGAWTKDEVVGVMPDLVAHELTHIIQDSRRLVLAAGGTMLSVWEKEGQATLAEEVVGHAVLGNRVGQDYGASAAFSDQGMWWYGSSAFVDLALYFGWLPPGTTRKASNAPEMCTLFGTATLATACSPAAFYGAAWSLERYISDRFGLEYPGGERQLHRDLIGANVGLAGVANVQSVLGLSFDTLFARWAGMLYADGRVAAAEPALTMSSWNLFNVMSAFVSDVFRLVPVDRPFGDFQDSRSVRAGSTAYTRISASSARPALALRVRDAGNEPLSPVLKPQLWVVRLQ